MSQITRHTDWKRHLAAYLASVATRKGQIGTHDCALFTAGAVAAMTGWSPDPSLTNYVTEAGGLRRLKGAGFADLPDFVGTYFDEQPVNAARAGDIALIDSPDGAALGIVQGAFVYVAGKFGVGLVPARRIMQSWRVS